MTVEEESAVVARVIAGDSDAFGELVLDNQKKVYNLALKMTGNGEDALDISQEAFIKAFTSLATFRAESRFSVWMYRLTYNLCIDFQRKRARTSTVSLAVYDDDGAEGEIVIPDVRALPEDEVLRHELGQALSSAIEKLPPKYREIIIMREVTGLSYSDIAVTLYLNEGTVKSRLSRARQLLSSMLIENGTFEPFERQNERKEVE